MQDANATLAAVLRLPQCVEVEPDKGCKRAVLNLANGMTIQLPASGAGFSLWGKSGSAAIGSDCLIVPTSPRQHVTQDQDAFKVLAGPDLPSLVKVWEAQAKQLFGA